MKKVLIKRIGFCLIAILVTVLITFTHAVAQEVPFYWDYINVNIDVQTNGDMLVTEEQKYVFKSDYSNQRYRYIRLDKVDEIKDVTVQENNQIIPSETGIENNQLWIRWEHKLKAPETHIFVLKYRVIGGLHINNENTQVYWKAIFADRKAPIQAAKVQVQLPEALAGKVLEFKNFGTVATARQVNPKKFEFIANQSIPPQQDLEIQVKFPREILNIPKPNWQASNFDNITSIIGVIILFILPIVLIFNDYRVAKNDRKCPQCQKSTLDFTLEVLDPETIRVIQHCKNCSYHNVVSEGTAGVRRGGGSSGGSSGGGCGGSSSGGGCGGGG